MPVPSGTPLDPAATRAKVLATASDLFYRHGVRAVGVNDIAASASASKLSIYRYFGSKEGLVEAMLTEQSATMHSWLAGRVVAVPPGRGRVLALFDALADWHAAREFGGCAVANAVTDTRGAQPAVREIARAHLARYRDLLTTLLTEAGSGDPDGLARALLLLIEGSLLVGAVDGGPQAGIDARRTAELLLDASIPD